MADKIDTSHRGINGGPLADARKDSEKKGLNPKPLADSRVPQERPNPNAGTPPPAQSNPQDGKK